MSSIIHLSKIETMSRLMGSNLALILSLVILGLMAKAILADADPGDDLLDYEIRSLRVGKERVREELQFDGSGQCLYELLDMKDGLWYEVKISYPASTPASFSIDLLPQFFGGSTVTGRRLLNTEKIIFQNDNTAFQVTSDIIRRARVSVKPEGFVTNPYGREQPFVVYNIALERVILGIPIQAFWVGFLGLLAICFSVLASRQIVQHLQPRYDSRQHSL